MNKQINKQTKENKKKAPSAKELKEEKERKLKQKKMENKRRYKKIFHIPREMVNDYFGDSVVTDLAKKKMENIVTKRFFKIIENAQDLATNVFKHKEPNEMALKIAFDIEKKND